MAGQRTYQRIFWQVQEHLLTQDCKAGKFVADPIVQGTQVFMCRYEDDDGKRCAIGCLMTDEELGWGDGFSFSSSANCLPQKFYVRLGLDKRSSTDRMFLEELQEIHDVELVRDWEEELKKFAKKYKLRTRKRKSR